MLWLIRKTANWKLVLSTNPNQDFYGQPRKKSWIGMVPNIPHNGEKWGILIFYVPIPHFEAIPWGMGNIPHGEIGLPMGKIGEFSSNI